MTGSEFYRVEPTARSSWRFPCIFPHVLPFTSWALLDQLRNALRNE